MTFLRQPTRAGVRDAAAKIAAILPPAPLLVAEIRGVPVAFKAESLQPVGAFKVRGAWHRLTAIAEPTPGKGGGRLFLGGTTPRASPGRHDGSACPR